MFTDWAEEGDEAKITQVLLKFQNIVSHGKMYRLRGIVSTVGCRSQARHMTSTEQHYECWRRDVTLKQSLPKRSCRTD